MQLTPARRVVAGLAVVVVALATASAPASAAPVDVSFYVRDVTASAGSGAEVRARYFADTEGSIDEPREVHELIGAPAGLTLASEDGYCENQTPTRLACYSPFPMEVGPELAGWAFEISVRVAATATPGTSATLRTTFTAAGVPAQRYDSRVRVAERVNLTGGPEVRAQAGPGGALDLPVVVRNTGDKAITGAAVTFDHDYGIDHTTRYRNCFYAGDALRSCVFDQTLEKGTAYGAAMPSRVLADTRAPSNLYGYRTWLTAAEFEDETARWRKEGYDPGTPGTGDVLTLTPRTATRGTPQADPDGDDNWSSVQITVTGSNGVDLAAAGTELAGTSGAEATMTVGARNVGTATLNRNRVGDPAAVTTVTIPAGATVTAAPAACYAIIDDRVDYEAPGRPGAPKYWCLSGYLFKVGTEDMYTFTLKLGSAAGTTTGTVGVNEPCECSVFTGDINPANNRATIRLTITPPVPGQQPATRPAVKPAGLDKAGEAASKVAKVLAATKARRR
jgi:hypothetical protein